MAFKSVCISSGHGKHVAGAVGTLNEVNEARKVVNKVAEYLKKLGVTVHSFHDDTSKDKNTNLKTIVNYHNSKTRELDISVHFNANKKTSSPMGTEVLYYNKKSEAASLSKAIAVAGGFKDRGPKERMELYFLKNTKKPALLIEVCFVDSTADAELYNKNFDKICRAIAENIAGKKLSSTSSTTKPSTSTSTSSKKTYYRVVVGSFTNKTNADNLVAELKKKGYSPYIATETK